MTEKVIIEVFEELHTINENLFSFELRYFAHARSPLLYRAYQKKSYEPHQARDFKEIARLYERRMELESTLESLTQGQIEQLIVAARNKQVPQLELAEILPVALVFLTQYCTSTI